MTVVFFFLFRQVFSLSWDLDSFIANAGAEGRVGMAEKVEIDTNF